MSDAMVTGRMSEEKKRKGQQVLEKENLNASQAINLMFDRLIEDNNARFLFEEDSLTRMVRWKLAKEYIDSIHVEHVPSRFDNMTKAEIKMERLRSKGLI